MKARSPHLASIVATIALSASFLAWPAAPASAAASFSDGFESGLVPPWTASSGLAVQQAEKHSGSNAARSVGSVAWASKTLPDVSTDIEVSLWFRFGSRQSPVWLTRVRTASNGNLVKVLVNNAGKLAYRNDVAGVTRTSSLVVTNGVWHRLQARVTVAGANGRVQVWLDGSPVAGLDRVESLGTAPAGKVEVGNRPTGKTYDLVLDDVDVTDMAAQNTLQPPGNLEVDADAPGGVTLTWSAPAGATPDGFEIYRDNLQVGSVGASATTFTDVDAEGVTRYVYTVISTRGVAERSVPSTPDVATMPGFDPTRDAVIYAAGDIACKPVDPMTATSCRHSVTAEMVAAGAADAILPLGDLQYEKGQLNNFLNSYDVTWGRVKTDTYPTPGNHEYDLDTSASGYDTYFLSTAPSSAGTWSPADPYYSFDLPQLLGWHFVALNSNCAIPEVGGCGNGSAQHTWLETDLADSTADCTIGYWHHPRWSSSSQLARRDDPATGSLWEALDVADADLVLSGHVHLYERFEPLDTSGEPDPAGIRSFIVGTGGRNFDLAGSQQDPSERLIDEAFGVLKLTLHQGSYDWAFVPEIGATETDSGSAPCV